MSKAILVDEFGGPEVMQWREVEIGSPSAGEVLVRHTAVGLNFIDTYHRSGLYPLELPAGLGTEAAGVVEAVASDVTSLQPGQRVAWVGVPPGSYAQQRIYPADRLVVLPDDIDEQVAAASLLKGLTAWYLLHRSYPAQSGDTVLLYAAAGGVGQIAAQWGNSLGVRMIGVAGNEAKAALARELGCAAVVLSDAEDFVAQVRDLTDGVGVAAVYDSVGRDTFFQSLDCLRPHGTMVTYGNATGPVDPFSPMELARRGSLFLTRPVLFDFIRSRAELESASAALFAAIRSGAVNINVDQTYPLADAAQAHRDLEARRTTGSTVLLP
jgi:NADPH2:quinone reductase